MSKTVLPIATAVAEQRQDRDQHQHEARPPAEGSRHQGACARISASPCSEPLLAGSAFFMPTSIAARS